MVILPLGPSTVDGKPGFIIGFEFNDIAVATGRGLDVSGQQFDYLPFTMLLMVAPTNELLLDVMRRQFPDAIIHDERGEVPPEPMGRC